MSTGLGKEKSMTSSISIPGIQPSIFLSWYQTVEYVTRADLIIFFRWSLWGQQPACWQLIFESGSFGADMIGMSETP